MVDVVLNHYEISYAKVIAYIFDHSYSFHMSYDNVMKHYGIKIEDICGRSDYSRIMTINEELLSFILLSAK